MWDLKKMGAFPQRLDRYIQVMRRGAYSQLVQHCREQMQLAEAEGDGFGFYYFATEMARVHSRKGRNDLACETYMELWSKGAPAFVGLQVVDGLVNVGRGESATQLLEEMGGRLETEEAGGSDELQVTWGKLNYLMADGIVKLASGERDQAAALVDTILRNADDLRMTPKFDHEFLVSLVRARQYGAAKKLLEFVLSISEITS